MQGKIGLGPLDTCGSSGTNYKGGFKIGSNDQNEGALEVNLRAEQHWRRNKGKLLIFLQQ